MELIEAIKERQSIRQFNDEKISDQAASRLEELIKEYNQTAGLHIKLVTDEPEAFGKSIMAKYGSFENVKNYLVIAGPKAADLAERCGYYGEKLVLEAQTLGLRSCWVAGTYKKNLTKSYLEEGDQMLAVIALGYSDASGRKHRRRSYQDVTKTTGEVPQWFKDGVEAALQAPTAINQQKFLFIYDNGKISAKALMGPNSKIDLGIVKCHFEIASGHKF